MRFLLLLLPLVLAAQPHSSTVILLIGPPGSGKTTQAKNLSAKYGIPSISMQDISKKGGGKRKDKRNRQITSDLLGDDLANSLIAQRLNEGDMRRGFILDGYPVTDKQGEYLETVLKDHGLPAPVIIHLDVPDNVVIDRMQKRHRADDTPQMIQIRLKEYHQEADAMLQRYRTNLIRVDGTKSESDVWRDIQAAMPR